MSNSFTDKEIHARTTERKKIILEDENLVALYKQLEKSEINQIF